MSTTVRRARVGLSLFALVSTMLMAQTRSVGRSSVLLSGVAQVAQSQQGRDDAEPERNHERPPAGGAGSSRRWDGCLQRRSSLYPALFNETNDRPGCERKRRVVLNGQVAATAAGVSTKVVDDHVDVFQERARATLAFHRSRWRVEAPADLSEIGAADDSDLILV